MPEVSLSPERLRQLADLVAGIGSSAPSLDDFLSSLAEVARDMLGAEEASCHLTGEISAPRGPTACSTLDVPLTNTRGREIGLLRLSDRPDREYTDADESAATLLARIAATAIETRRLADDASTSRRNLRAVTDALPGGILARSVEGQVTYSNRWLFDYLEMERDDIEGKAPGDPYRLLDEHGELLPLDDYPSSRAGRGERFDSAVVGMPGPRGQLRWLATSGRPLVDERGETVGGLIVFVDNTEHVEAQRQLARREMELIETQRIGGIGSFSRNLHSEEIVVSDEFRRLAGLGADEKVDLEVLYRFVHPEERTKMVEATRRTYESGVPFAGVIRGLTNSGLERTIEVHVARFDGADGKPAGLRGTIRDLTDILDHEERLARAQRMETIGRLAGGLAHDFNNLLTVLSSHADLLRIDADDRQRASIEAIAAATERASRLTRQLLEYGRREVLQPQATDVNTLLTHLHEMSRSAVPPGIRLDLELPDEPPFALVDPQKLEQVVLNLILNARDALVDQGRIVVRPDITELATTDFVAPGLPPGRYVRIVVDDDGPGMTTDVLARALEPFFTTKPLGTGTGLGLATSYGIIAQSGGMLSLDSEPGAGTRATVLLPVAQRPRDEAPTTGTRRPERVVATILLAEDDDQLRPLLALALEGRGHQVLTASDGVDALRVAAAAGGTIDLLITDVSMPGRGGAELATLLREARPTLPVLYMSGYTDDAVLRQAAEDRSIDFIPKPFRLEQFVDEVDEILDRRSDDE